MVIGVTFRTARGELVVTAMALVTDMRYPDVGMTYRPHPNEGHVRHIWSTTDGLPG